MVAKERTERVKEELRAAIRRAKRKQSDLERTLGWTRGYLSQIFTDRIDLKMEHVFALLNELGIEPGQFFASMYPVPSTSDDPEELIRAKVIEGLGTAVSEHDKDIATLKDQVEALLVRVEALSGGEAGPTSLTDRARGRRR